MKSDNSSFYIIDQEIALDDNDYVAESWSVGYEDGVYNLTPTIPTGKW